MPETEPVYPQVSFDIGLGKKLKRIDFDYGRYIGYLTSRGLSNEQIAQTKLTFKSAKVFNTIAVRGTYNLDKQEINIFVGRLIGKRYVNRALRHETQHSADHAQGRPTHRLLSDITQKSMRVGAIAGITAIGFKQTVERIDHNQITHFTSEGLGSTSLALMLGGLIAYRYINPIERRAHAAGKDYSGIFVSIDNKSLMQRDHSASGAGGAE